MDHQWRAALGSIQGNICPRCSTPHFPFCAPNSNSGFPVVNNPFNIDPMHTYTQPPVSSYTMVDPFHGPRFWERNPNLNASHSQYHIQPPSVAGDPGNASYTRGSYLAQRVDYGANAIAMGSDYGVNDRSSKRLKLDGTHLASYATEAYRNPSMALSSEDERRLKLIHEHGGVMNGLAPSGQDYNPRLHESSADHSSNLSGEYHLNSQVGHLHSQSYGRTNTPVENQSLGVHAPPHAIIEHSDQTKHGHRAHYSNLHNGRHYPPTGEIDVQPPLSTTPPPLPASLPPPLNIPGQWITQQQPKPSTASARSSFLFPVDVRSTPAHSLYPPVPEAHSMAPAYPHISQSVHSSGGMLPKDSQGHLKHNVAEPKVIDVVNLFKPPNRERRPDHFVIILRGLPGSGKSYLARLLRDLEVEHGGKAPRIHSMDDYFMTEVDKVEENNSVKSSARGKKPVVKKVLEYCYEPEMEEAYRSSMLKAFKKTLDEGSFTFVIVDDRNLRVADFAQFWATAKRSGYEVYLLETSYKDPVGCTARNIHGFTRDDVQKMAGLWEEAPSLYLQLDAKSLFHGDDSKESNIQEVDMDMDDEDLHRGSFILEERKQENGTAAMTSEEIGNGVSKDKKPWDTEADHPDEEVKDLRCSKWSSDFDEDGVEGSNKVKSKLTALSGLHPSYGKEGKKSVHWGDQIPNTGFSIGAMKKANAASLIIGPGSGYNLKSNPVPVEQSHVPTGKRGDMKKQSVFQEHLRAERESFKAVFDRRRQRIED